MQNNIFDTRDRDFTLKRVMNLMLLELNAANQDYDLEDRVIYKKFLECVCEGVESVSQGDMIKYLSKFDKNFADVIVQNFTGTTRSSFKMKGFKLPLE